MLFPFFDYHSFCFFVFLWIRGRDLVILDVMMSTWQDGFEMSRELKKDPKFKDIPILILTALKDRTGIDFKSTVGDSTWLPVDEFLDKPVEPQTLLAEVEKLLSRKA